MLVWENDGEGIWPILWCSEEWAGEGSSPVLLCGVGEEDVLVVILDELMRRLADCRQ